MKAELVEFIDRIDGFSGLEGKLQVDYFVYFLTSKNQQEAVTGGQIKECYRELSLREYSRIPSYLSDESRGSKGRYLKHKKGYKLEKRTFDKIDSLIRHEPKKIQVSQQLSDLVSQIKNSQEKDFLIEAINCYRVEAYRATIVMVWTLVVDHLQQHVFGQRLNDFNLATSSHSDKKMKQIINYSDFSDMKEYRFIELMRSAGVISNDIRKILDEKLGIRNSAGHPSGVVFSGHKTTEFILDLVSNVLLKY